MAIPFLSDIILKKGNKIQFTTDAGANAGTIDTDSNGNLVFNNTAGDILLGDGASDVYIGDGTNNVDIIFEQSGAIKGDGSAVTLTLGGANTTLNLENPNINGNFSIGATAINNKLTFTTANGYILFDYEPSGDTGEYTTEVPLLKVGLGSAESTILSRLSEYRAVALGADDTVWLRAGDTGAVIKTNVNLTAEQVVMSAEGGFIAYGFPVNDTAWSNRVEFQFRTDSGTASDNGLYIGDGGKTQFIDLSRNLKNIGTIASGAITSTDKLTINKSSTHTAQGSISATNAHLDLYNSLEANTDQKGSIITFTDNYYGGSSYNKTLRAAIKGGTDTVGNTADGYLEFYTDSGGADTPNLALRLDKNQDATFEGDVSLSGGSIKNTTGTFVMINNAGAQFDIKSNQGVRLYIDKNNDDTTHKFEILANTETYASNNVVSSIDQSGNATFAGNLTLESASPVLKIDATGTNYPEILFTRITGDDQNAKIILGANQLRFENEGDPDGTFLFQGRAAGASSLSDFLKIEDTGITAPGATFTGTVTANGTTLTGATDISGKVSKTGDTITSGTNAGLTINHDSFGLGLIVHRNHADNSPSITFKNNDGQQGILFAQEGDNNVYWRQGTNATNHKIWHAGNDGSGSGLDADLLDGNQASDFAPSSVVNQSDFVSAANGGTFNGNLLVNAQLAVNSTTINTVNKLEVHGQARINGKMMIGDSTISNVPNAAVQLHIKNAGQAGIRLEDSDSSNLAFDLISNEGVGFIIKETVGGDSGDDIRLTIAESTGNATFSGTVTANGTVLTGATSLAGLATESYVDTAVADLIDSAPGTLNTLDELASALGDDAAFSTTVTTALGNRVRVDTASQGLTNTEKSNARTNIGAQAAGSYQASGNYITGTGSLSAQDLTDIGNLSGTNTGDQDLSGYSTTSHNHDGRYLRTHSRYSDDLDTITTSGVYIWDVSEADDEPTGASDGLLTIKYWDSSFWATASFQDFHNRKLHIKSKKNGTWQTDWAQVWTTDQLTTTDKTNYDTAYTHSQAAHAPSDAEQNVQSNWNATSGDAYILNKPTIPTDYGDHDGLYLEKIYTANWTRVGYGNSGGVRYHKLATITVTTSYTDYNATFDWTGRYASGTAGIHVHSDGNTTASIYGAWYEDFNPSYTLEGTNGYIKYTISGSVVEIWVKTSGWREFDYIRKDSVTEGSPTVVWYNESTTTDTGTEPSNLNAFTNRTHTAAGYGTSNLAIGTTSTTAMAGDTTIPSGNSIIDWSAENAGTIHTSNYIENVTQTSVTGNAGTVTINEDFSGTYPLLVEVTGSGIIYNNPSITYNGTTDTLTSPNFAGSLTGNVTGNASSVTNGFYTTGDQSASGTKTFSGILDVSGTAKDVLSQSYVEIYVYGDDDKYYPVTIAGASSHYGYQKYHVSRRYNWTAPSTWNTSTHMGALTLTWEHSSDTAWGGNDKDWRVIQFDEVYSTVCNGMSLAVTEGMVVWLRGGGTGGAKYRVSTPRGAGTNVKIYDNKTSGGSGGGTHVASTTFTAGNGTTYSVESYSSSNVDSRIKEYWPVRGKTNHYRGQHQIFAAIDEDNFASNSATRVPTQQSTKAYVDAHTYSHNHAASDINSGTLANARISSSSITQHEDDIDHDALTNFVTNEHIDWTAENAGTIHSSNYVDNGTVTGGGAANKLAFWTDAGVIDHDDYLAWDNSNNRLGINKNSPAHTLDVLSGNTAGSINTVRVHHTRNDSNVASQALKIDANFSGSDNTTADVVHSGLYIDLDSSMDGDGANEVRSYGVHVDARTTGFNDQLRGGYFYVESNNTTEKTGELTGVHGSAVHDSSSANGGVTNMIGVKGNVQVTDNGDVDNSFGVYGLVTVPNSRGANVDQFTWFIW